MAELKKEQLLKRSKKENNKKVEISKERRGKGREWMGVRKRGEKIMKREEEDFEGRKEEKEGKWWREYWKVKQER